MRFIIIVALVFSAASPAFAHINGSALSDSGQTITGHNPDSERVTKNTIFDSRVRTLMLYREGWDFSLPILNLTGAGDQRLTLRFDIVDERIDNLAYSFIHCDKDWNRSSLFTTDYLDGFHENMIEEYRQSFNTNVNYTHYTLSFPNERVSFLVSGNYIIVVHPPGQPDNPLFSRRFMISESGATIAASVKRPSAGVYRDTHQQVDITVNISGIRAIDPHNEIFTSIMQNGRWDNKRANMKADFISSTELRYTSLGDKTLFPGGNEFRQFDIRSFRHLTEFVAEATYDGQYHHVRLLPSQNREFRPYFFRPDLNGRFIVGVQEGVNPHTDADYAWVYFTLPSGNEIRGGTLHIHGELTSWTPSGDNRMIYNHESRAYEAALFLKQGWYNYKYTFVPDGTGEELLLPYEGSHFETSNEYFILVYYRPRGERYDRLIGTHAVVNPAG